MLLTISFSVSAEELSDSEKENAAEAELLTNYQDYQHRLASIVKLADIEDNGFSVIEDQIFPLETECFGSVSLVPAIEKEYRRLVLFLITEDGTVVYRTDQLETNNRNRGSLKQPLKEISAVSFLDVNRDGRQHIILTTSCK